jgi:hypothetical protein
MSQTQYQTRPSFLNKITSSKRLALTYIVLGIWIALAVFGILVDTDLYALAVYFASGLPIILGYLWSETSRPTSLKDAADIVKGINRPNIYNGISNYGNYGNNYSGIYDTYDNITNNDNENINQNLVPEFSIFSDDYSIELKVNDIQLSTLQNLGYINNDGTKYTFIKSQIIQIKNLINDNLVDPTI